MTMRWSYSKSKIFFQCQRKWYYMEILANARTKDTFRKEAYILKQLKSIYAWRGSVVDNVIEKFIVPKIKMRRIPSEEEVIDFSNKLIDKQLKFGRLKKYRLPEITKSVAADEYSAFFDVEYNGDLDENELLGAKNEVKVSLLNLIKSDFLKEIMENSKYIISQRPLQFQYADTSISCTPDLLIFYENRAPSIIDWKVHAFANADYRLQLGIYGFALSRINPHKDFPKDSLEIMKNPTEIQFIEYQLLKNKIRNYYLDSNDFIIIENYIYQSITQINRLINGGKFEQLDINQFKTALSPNLCESCSFKKICWRGDIFESN